MNVGRHGAARRPGADELRAPSRAGRFVRLAPVGRQHTDFLYALAVDDVTGFRWRFNGSVPRPDVFVESLWSGVLCQFVVEEIRHGVPRGTAVAYNADLNHGYCYVGVAMTAEAQETGLAVEAFLLLARHLFASYRLRKLYMEVPEYNLRPIERAIGPVLVEEGRLRDHTYYGERLWDRLYLAVYPERLEPLCRRLLRPPAGPPEAATSG
jgi:RimJ/RimL family protein N-acetyltransferase